MITGPIIVRDELGNHDLRADTWPTHRADRAKALSIVDSNAKFVLLLEKQNIFKQLLKADFPGKHDCVLVGGYPGYPSLAARALMRQLHDQFHLPIYVLADNDPGGYELFFLIARGGVGSLGPARGALAIPEAMYIGLRVDDCARHDMQKTMHISMGETDQQHLARLAAYTWLQFDAPWQREIAAIRQRGTKVEMEALHWISPTWLSETYLPERLEAGDHLRLAGNGDGRS